MMMVRRMVIRIILGSYLQFGGTVSRGRGGQMCWGTSWFIHSHFSVSIAPHCAAHIVPDIVISQSPRRVLLHVGSAIVQGTDYWDFTPCSCASLAVCHTSHILTMFRQSEIKPALVNSNILFQKIVVILRKGLDG